MYVHAWVSMYTYTSNLCTLSLSRSNDKLVAMSTPRNQIFAFKISFSKKEPGAFGEVVYSRVGQRKYKWNLVPESKEMVPEYGSMNIEANLKELQMAKSGPILASKITTVLDLLHKI